MASEWSKGPIQKLHEWCEERERQRIYDRTRDHPAVEVAQEIKRRWPEATPLVNIIAEHVRDLEVLVAELKGKLLSVSTAARAESAKANMRPWGEGYE